MAAGQSAVGDQLGGASRKTRKGAGSHQRQLQWGHPGGVQACSGQNTPGSRPAGPWADPSQHQRSARKTNRVLFISMQCKLSPKPRKLRPPSRVSFGFRGSQLCSARPRKPVALPGLSTRGQASSTAAEGQRWAEMSALTSFPCGKLFLSPW